MNDINDCLSQWKYQNENVIKNQPLDSIRSHRSSFLTNERNPDENHGSIDVSTDVSIESYLCAFFLRCLMSNMIFIF